MAIKPKPDRATVFAIRSSDIVTGTGTKVDFNPFRKRISESFQGCITDSIFLPVLLISGRNRGCNFLESNGRILACICQSFLQQRRVA